MKVATLIISDWGEGGSGAMCFTDKDKAIAEVLKIIGHHTPDIIAMDDGIVFLTKHDRTRYSIREVEVE